jgi:Do/DeqQ family serine protease
MKTMKEKLQILGAMVGVGVVTSIATCGIMIHQSSATDADVPSTTDSGALRVGFSPAVSGASVTDNDFTRAAELTVNAVVGVRSAQRMQQMSATTGDPFFDLFFGYRGQQQAPRSKEGYGSGVIISSDGYIVTNNHVIENADTLQVTLNDKRQFNAVLVGTDPSTDIALLKVEATDLPTISFGASDDLKVGEWVLAVGNPFMLNSTVTAGIVSAKARTLGMQSGKLSIESFIQTDAAVNPGNSGGALVNTAGQLVGINTAIYSQTGNYAGYSFAVPSSIVSKVVTDLRQYGTVQRAVLGISIRDVDADLATAHHLSVSEGIYVEEVSERSAAEVAGMRAGDVVTRINDVTVKTVAQLQEQVARFRPGDKIRVTYLRDGKSQTVEVTLKNVEGSTDVVKKRGMELLGATFQSLTRQQQMDYGVRNGVLVKSLEKKGLLAQSGVRENFVIVKINDATVNSQQDVQRVYESLTTQRGEDKEPVMFIVGVYPGGKTAYYAVDLSK